MPQQQKQQRRDYYDPTPGIRDEMVGHINYEIEQMTHALWAVEDIGWDNRNSWLVSEAGLLHARSLMEFLFYPSTVSQTGGQDARATWYTTRAWRLRERKQEFEAHAGNFMSEIKRRIDRKICHLAVDRAATEVPHLIPIGGAVNIMWRTFHTNLEPEWKGRFPL